MNGDLSLSQSFGGLRIANPDNDVNQVSSLPAPAPAPIGRAHHIQSFSRFADNEHHIDLHKQAPSVDPLGISQPTPSFDPLAAGHGFQDVPQSIPRNSNRPVAAGRPVSGLYNHPNASSGSGPIPESRYHRLKAESSPTSNSPISGTVRRSNSKAATGATTGVAGSKSGMGGVYRQASQSKHNTADYQPHGSSDEHGRGQQSQPGSRSSSYHTAASPRSAEDWQEKGVAVGTLKTIDQRGKPATKVIKKGVKDFAFGRTLGEGSYSTVLAATDRQTSREYAIKVLDKRHIIKEKKVKYVNIEKDTLNRLTEHPGIVRLYYTFQDERSLYFVLDLAAGGELLGHLKKTLSFDEDCTRFYSAQILDAIEYMHERGIIHRDLKPENVLLDDQMHVKITDFGTAKILDLTGKKQFGAISVSNDPMDGADTDRAVSFVGTAEYVSPELLTDKNACKASDLWAFGCIVFQLLAGRPPFKAANEYLTFQKIVHHEFSFPDGFPSLARDLVSKLLVLDPTQRPHIEIIKKHPFFEGVQWGKGLWKQKAPRLRPFLPTTSAAHAATAAMSRDLAPPPAPPRSSSYQRMAAIASSPPAHQPRPQQRIITELAPPTQLDIDWSPVLTKSNERIMKLGQFVINSHLGPHGTSSKSGPEPPVEAPSKFSRFFGAKSSKSRQRLVMVTSGGRLIVVPAGGEKKEVKQSIELTDDDVSWRSTVDPKGYTIWVISTRDKYLMFEDPRANTGDPGSSVRSTQEWLTSLDEVKQYALSQKRLNSPDTADPGVNGLSPQLSSTSGVGSSLPSSAGVDSVGGASRSEGIIPTSNPQMRRTLRRDPSGHDGEDHHRRKMFGNKRHSKNGLAAVF